MSHASLDLFGQFLMSKVRDEAISDWKMIVDGRMKGERAARIREVLGSFRPEDRQAFFSLIPEITNSVLHHLLWALEQQDNIKIGVLSRGELVHDLKDVSDGLAGELYSDEGWIAKYSREK